ncbi:unnamed protein product [Durusdinium trenchii]|uniref:Uncharacterized protein n=2 Tax=Durusdinium trenchii TaxID=1381693 RepID=A0ABP0PG34_9DINO
MELAELRAMLREVVVKACELTSFLQASLLKDEVLSKGDFSPVTVADFACQALITLLLDQRYPLPMVGEEDAKALRENAALAGKVHGHVAKFLPGVTLEEVLDALDRGRHEGGLGTFWVLDPIDGTKGFLRKAQYAICLCLVKDGDILVSALGCPNLPVSFADPESPIGCVFHAAKGLGCVQLNLHDGAEHAVRVDALRGADATYVESYESAHSSHSQHAQIAERLKLGPPRRMDSQCKFGVLARGEASLYLRLSDRDQSIWDIAPGAMVVQEAGGQVTDVRGRPLSFSAGRTVGVPALFASNGMMHEEVLKAIAGMDS